MLSIFTIKKDIIMLKAGWVIILFLCIPNTLFADEEKPDFKVGMNINADSDLEARIKSYISRELRSLVDVRILADNPDYEINIIAIKLRTTFWNRAGVAVSTNFVKYIWVNESAGVLPDPISEATKETGTQRKLCVLKKHIMNVGAYKNLKTICSEIVAKFDIDVLEPHRKQQ